MENSYALAMPYEFFITRAIKCGYNEHQAKNAYLQNLINTERGADLRSTVGNYDKQLKEVKKNIEKAILKFLKSKPTVSEKVGLEKMLSMLTSVYSTREILSLLEEGLEITKRYK
jgi:hemerythrin superfamily protein